MKCPRCNGNGSVLYPIDYEQGLFDETNCPLCGGSGEFDPNEVDRFNAVDFIKVLEMVKKPLTNEEWLRSCNTEQLAEFLLKIGEIDEAPIPCGDLMECSKNCGRYSQCAGDDVMPTNKEIWWEWLKQPHTSLKNDEK